MSDLRQLLRSAVFNPGPLDLSELRRRIIRRRRRRAATVVVTSVVAVTVMVGVFATVAAGDHHSEARVETSADSTVPVDATTSSSVGATSTTAAPTAPIVPTDTTTRTTPPQTSPPQSVVTAPVVITTPATVPTPITTPPSTEPPTTTTTTVPRPAACSTTPIGVAIYPTQAAFEAAITGRWFLCNTPSIFFTSNEIGLELTADHHWKKLFGSFDAPTLGNDPSDYGTWLSLDVTDMNGPGSYQINLVNNHRGTISTIPIISANGTRMRVDNNGDNFTDYVRVSMTLPESRPAVNRHPSKRGLLATTVAVAVASALAITGLQLRSTPPAAASLVFRTGYELVGSDGGVFTEGAAHFSGSLGNRHIDHKIVAVLGSGANNTNGPGYLLVDSAGVVYPFGLQSRGDLRGVHLRSPIVAATEAEGLSVPNGGGYIMVAADGGVFAFGTAPFPGSLAPFHLPAPIVGIEKTGLSVRGQGFRLVDAVGRVYALGPAPLYGDFTGSRPSAPVVGIIESQAPTATHDGYLIATADGKVTPFGGADWRGDVSHFNLRAPIVGIENSLVGYYLFAKDGGVFAFGGAPYLGSLGALHLNGPIAAMGFQRIEHDTCSGLPRAAGLATTTPPICPV